MLGVVWESFPSFMGHFRSVFLLLHFVKSLLQFLLAADSAGKRLPLMAAASNI